MRLWTRLATAGATLTVAMAAIAVPASAATTTTRWVDNDGRAGPNGCGGSAAAATSIQSAVNASNADDVVIVCPGTYTGQVRIRGSRDGLTLRASSAFGATIKAPASVAEPLGFTYLVLVERVDDVTIQGFKVVTRTSGPCEDLEVTIAALGSHNTAIRGNRLLAPGSDGSEDCSQNLGIAVTNGIEGGMPGGPASFTATTTIAYNEVRDARFGGIATFAVGGRVRATIARNSVRAYFGFPPAGGSGLGSTDGTEFGIALIGRSRGTVRDNAIQGSSAAPANGPRFFAGIAIIPSVDGGSSAAVNGPVDIRGNLVRRVAVGFYAPQSARDLTIRRNVFRNASVGITLVGTTDSTVNGNVIGARDVGIHVASDSVGNTLTNNAASGVGGSCLDGSSGSGTDGTANTWSGNTATLPSNPSGICSVGP